MCQSISELFSIPLICVSIPSPIPRCFDYCHFILILNLRNVIPPTLALLFKSVLPIQVPLPFHINFKISVSIYSIFTDTFLFGKGDKKMPGMGWLLVNEVGAH